MMDSPKKISFQSSLMVLLVLILLPLLFFQAYTYYESFQRRYDQELKANSEIAHAAGKMFEQFIAGILRQEAAVGSILALPESIAVADINQTFYQFQKQHKFIRNFSWVSPEGYVIASDFPEAIGFDVRQKSYFAAIKNGLNWHISDLHPSIITGELIFSVSTGIRSASGQLKAIMVANISQKNLDRELSLHRSGGADISITDSKGTLVYNFPSLASNWGQRNWLEAYPGLQSAMNGNDYMGSLLSPQKGEEILVAHVPVSFGWVASASRTQAEALAPIYDILFERALFFLLILCAAIIVPLFISRRFTVSIRRLSQYAESVGRGDYVRHPGFFRVSEFQFLADSFQKMADQVKVREEALAKEQKVLGDIVRSTDVTLVSIDRDFNFIAVNPAYLKICGKAPEELIGQNFFQLYPQAEIQAIAEGVRDTGQTVFRKDEALMLPGRPEGSITYWDWSLSPIKKEGAVAGFTFAMRETTQYKEAQDRLRLHARILESMTEGVVVTNEQSIIVYCNPAEDAMFGYGAGALIGKDAYILSDFTPDESRRVVNEVREKIWASGSWKGEWRNRKKDGSVFFTHSHVSRLDLNDHVLFVSVQIDITEEKMMKESLLAARNELQRANEQLEQKVSQRTEELDTANKLIKNAYEQLERRAAKLRALASELTSIEQGVRKQIAKVLHDHLQQVLVATKLRVEALSERCEVKMRKEDLMEMIDLLKEAIQITRSVTTQLIPPILFHAGLQDGLKWLAKWMKQKHGFKVHLELDERVPPIAEDLRVFLFEAARELLFNAVKHAGVHAASVMLRQSGRNSLNIVVADNGKGFDPNGLKTSSEYAGFGLFSIIERIPLFDGSIEIDSSPGKGSRFSLTIPFSESKETLSDCTLLENA